jgi:hypothetical protein
MYLEYVEQENPPDVIKQHLETAFKTKSRFDVNKISRLLSYKKDENIHPMFKAVLDTIEESKTMNGFKTYYQLALKNNEGQYENINLNLPNA